MFHDDLDMGEFFLDEREDQLVPLPRVRRRILTKKTTDMVKSISLSLFFLCHSGLAYFLEDEVRYAPLFENEGNHLLRTTS